ncbi:hypothetical protein V3481_018872 [Fusarium oxysporum f. sp. vasinfectum]
MLGRLTPILLPLMALTILFVVGMPKVYKWPRPGISVSPETSPASVSSCSQPRDLPHLDALAPSRTSKYMRWDIMHHVHASWAVSASNMTCAICLCDVMDTDMVRQLDCQQIFHSDCIAAWYLVEDDTYPMYA